MKILNKHLRVHTKKQCKGQYCCLHNPSDHHMKDWPIFIRMDKNTLAERVCTCGIGHPDPDSLKYLVGIGCSKMLTMHGCCGHCDPKLMTTTHSWWNSSDKPVKPLTMKLIRDAFLKEKKCSTKKRKR